MKLRKLFFRDEQECSVEAVEHWSVKWTAYQEVSPALPVHCDIYRDRRQKTFLSKDSADSFAKALRAANKLLGNKKAKVSVKKGR